MVYQGNARSGRVDPTSDGNGPARSSHLKHGAIHKQGNGSSYAMLLSSTKFFRQRKNCVQYGPDSLPPGVFNQPDAFFDIRITGAGVHTVDSMSLRMQISNFTPTPPIGTDPASAIRLIPVLPFYWLNRLEVQPNGGTTEDTIYPDQMATDWWLRASTEMKATMGKLVGVNTAGPNSHVAGNFTNQSSYDEDGIWIEAGESREYFVPIHTFLTTCSLFLPAKSQDPRLRFYCAAQPVASDSGGNARMVLDGADMVISGTLYEGYIVDAMIKHYRTIPTVSRILVHERQNLDVQNAQPFVRANDLSLTVFNGAYAYLTLYMKRNGPAKEYLYDSNRTKTNEDDAAPAVPVVGHDQDNWITLSRFTLTDSNGNPVFYNEIPAQYLSKIIGNEQFPNTFIFGEKNLYLIPFCDDSETTLLTGENSGGMALDSNFQLAIVPGAYDVVAGDSFSLQINGMRYALLTMTPAGTFTVKKL